MLPDNYLDILLRLVLAVVFGGVIGIERAGTNHEAGLRTHILVCLGAAGVMIMSEMLVADYGGDISRIGAQVVSGIGFLGTGCILVNGNRIRGLTTAAGLWTTACVSEHLNELSGNGEMLRTLNKWERTVYYVDELCVEVNSGGFDSYLYYHGTHFGKAYTALKDIAALNMLSILDTVRDKFPKHRIPANEDTLQNTMDLLEEKGIDFETEDEYFYSAGEKELLEYLLSYVKENKQHLR